MRLNLPGVVLIMAGVLLMYSAQQNRDPRNVIYESLGIKRRVPDPSPGAMLGGIVGEAIPKIPVNTPGVPVVTV